jgi:hypothetical protein
MDGKRAPQAARGLDKSYLDHYFRDEANVDFTKLMCEVMVQGGFRPKTDDGLTKHELIKNKRGKVTLQKAAAACATKRVRKIAKSRLAKPAFQGGLKATSRWTVDAVHFQVFARS